MKIKSKCIREVTQTNLVPVQKTRVISYSTNSVRPAKCKIREQRLVVSEFIKNRWASLKTLKGNLRGNDVIDISRQTVSRVLQKHAPFRQVAKTRQLVTKVQRKKRLDLPRNHSDWTLEQWQKVIFCDEKIFHTVNHRKRQLVTRKNSEKFSRECIVHAPKYGIQICCRLSGNALSRLN